jgi:hypothetical protein
MQPLDTIAEIAADIFGKTTADFHLQFQNLYLMVQLLS